MTSVKFYRIYRILGQDLDEMICLEEIMGYKIKISGGIRGLERISSIQS